MAINSANTGGYLVAGTSINALGISPSPANVLVYQLDANLNILWGKDFLGSYGCYNTLSGQAIYQQPDNTIYVGVGVTGYCLDGGSPSHVLFQLDPGGAKVGEKAYSIGELYDLIQTAGGNFISYSEYSNVAKIAPPGEVAWARNFKYELGFTGKNAAAEFPDGRLAFAGRVYNNGYKAVVVVTDSLANNCRNRLGGHVFFDQNGNCKRDNGEIGLQNKLLELNTGLEYTLSDQDGHFLFITDTSVQNIRAYPTAYSNQTSDFWQVACPPAGIHTFGPSAPYQKPDSLDFGLMAADICPVFQVKSTLSSSRICREGNYRLEVCNEGSQDATLALVQLKFPAEFKFLSANFPYTFNGTAYTFDLGALATGSCRTLIVTDSIVCTALLGTSLCIEATVNGSPDCPVYQYEHTDQLCRVLVNSYDPNDITGWVDNRQPCFPASLIGEKADLEYVIRFQNTGNDTAYRVVVIDTLPAGRFDMSTFRPGWSSHPYRLDFRGDHTLMWIFDEINLTDTLTDVAKSQGLVTFRIRTAQPLTAGDEIRNQAAIYFDANPPVITAENTVRKCLFSGQSEAAPTGNTLRLAPNPAAGYTELLFSDPLTEAVQIGCYDFSGVLMQQISLPAGTSNWRLSTQTWPAGLYYLRTGAAGLKYAPGKLVVMH